MERELLKKLVDAFPQADPASEFYDEEIDGCEAVNFLSEFIPQVREQLDAQPVAAEHPLYTKADWQSEVANGDSRLGYKDWVAHQIESNTDSNQSADITVAAAAGTHKKLTIPVKTVDEYFTESADYAVIELDSVLVARIRQLAAVVKELKIYKTAEYNYACDFLTWDSAAELVDGKIALVEFEGRMECTTLNVTDGDFFWSGYYKHTDVYWETESIPFEELDKPEDLDMRESE